MIRNALILSVLFPLAAGLFACASREEIRAEREAKQVVMDSEDDATCRARAEPGSPGYQTCRQDLAAQRAQREAIDYQKARDFDRVLGGLDDL